LYNNPLCTLYVVFSGRRVSRRDYDRLHRSEPNSPITTCRHLFDAEGGLREELQRQARRRVPRTSWMTNAVVLVWRAECERRRSRAKQISRRSICANNRCAPVTSTEYNDTANMAQHCRMIRQIQSATPRLNCLRSTRLSFIHCIWLICPFEWAGFDHLTGSTSAAIIQPATSGIQVDCNAKAKRRENDFIS
jgi:hypothetical protein